MDYPSVLKAPGTMAKAAEALVTPAVLVWARESLNLSLEAAGKKLKVKPERLAAWEEGSRRPTVNQLRKIANAYKRPLAVFFLPTVPKDFQVAMHDFRRLPADKPPVQTMALRLEIRKAVERRQVALELAKALEVELPDVALTCEMTEAPETVAGRIRDALGVSIDQQRGWATNYEALNAWRRAVERLGVLVFHADQVPVKDARGFSINDRPLPAVIVNAKDAPQARVFTLFHELTHLLLREGGLCDLHEDVPRMAGPSPEVFCNHVAGAVIAPASALNAEPSVMSHSPRRSWDDHEVEVLARRYWMSREAMMRRLTLVGAATNAEYERYRAVLASAPKKPTKGGFVSPSTKSLRNLGFFFTSLAVGAYREEVITGSDLADHLELKLKHLPKIEDALARGAVLDEGRV